MDRGDHFLDAIAESAFLASGASPDSPLARALAGSIYNGAGKFVGFGNDLSVFVLQSDFQTGVAW